MAELLTDFIDRVAKAFEGAEDTSNFDERLMIRAAVDLVDVAGTWERNFALAGLFVGAFRDALVYRYPQTLFDESHEEAERSWNEAGPLAPILTGHQTREEYLDAQDEYASERSAEIHDKVTEALRATS